MADIANPSAETDQISIAAILTEQPKRLMIWTLNKLSSSPTLAEAAIVIFIHTEASNTRIATYMAKVVSAVSMTPWGRDRSSSSLNVRP